VIKKAPAGKDIRKNNGGKQQANKERAQKTQKGETIRGTARTRDRKRGGKRKNDNNDYQYKR